VTAAKAGQVQWKVAGGVDHNYEKPEMDKATRELARPAHRLPYHGIKGRRSTANAMRFHAKHVSAAKAGGYCQVMFEAEDPGDGATDPPPGLVSPYLLIQRRFESPDGGCCYVETHDRGYIGHWRLRLIDFSSTYLAVEIERKSDTHVEVSYALNTAEFKKVRRIVSIIFGQQE
jgi:hypothetical protein